MVFGVPKTKVFKNNRQLHITKKGDENMKKILCIILMLGIFSSLVTALANEAGALEEIVSENSTTAYCSMGSKYSYAYNSTLYSYATTQFTGCSAPGDYTITAEVTGLRYTLGNSSNKYSFNGTTEGTELTALVTSETYILGSELYSKVQNYYTQMCRRCGNQDYGYKTGVVYS